MMRERTSPEEQLLEVWALVDELGDLSNKLRDAADRAVEAMEERKGRVSDGG